MSATILAVDDNSASLALLVNLLTTANYRVLPADSGELALAAVAASPPDLILLDVRMPGVDGLEVCRRLKAREETRPIPIILISPFADVKDWVEGLQLGAADYITKPFQTEELLSRVRTHLALRRARVSLEQQAVALGQATERLQSEVDRRQLVEDELRGSLERAERSRRATLSTLEDLKRSQEQTALRVRQQAVIAELGQLALVDGELPVLMDQTVRRVAQVLDVEMCKVLELLPDRSAFLLRAGVGWQEGLVGRATVDIRLESQAGFTLQSKGPVVVEDLWTETRFHGPQLLHDHQVVSGLSTVIGEPGRPYGVLGAHTTRWRAFTVDDVHFLEGVAHLLGSAVQRSAHEAEIERLNRLYATLSQVNQAIVRCTSVEELFQQLCRVVVEFGRFEVAWVALKARDGGQVTAVASHAAAPHATLTFPEQTDGCGIIAEAVLTGRPCLSNDAQRDERTASCRTALSRLGVRSCAAFPFRRYDEVCGALSICSMEAGFFNPDEVRLLDEVALDISFALERFDQEARRRQAEAALRDSQSMLQQSQAVARIGHYVLDVSSGVWTSGETLDEVFGIGPEHGRTVEGWLSLVHPDDREEMRGCIGEIRDGQPLDRDYRIVRPSDGAVRWVRGTASLELAAEGRPVRMIGVVQDITERKRSEQEIQTLLHSVQKERTALSALISSIADEVWFADTQGIFTLANPSARKEFCLASDQEISVEELARSLEVFRPDGSPRPVQEAPPLRALAGEVVLSQEEIVRTPATGALRNRLVNATPVRDSSGSVVGAVSVVRDITDRKKAEADRVRLTVAIEQAAETVMVTDAKGTIQYVNPVFETVTGYTRAEAVGQNPRILKSGAHEEEFYRGLWDTLTSGRVWQGRFVNRKKDGSLYQEETTISPVRDDAGRIVNFVSVRRDITEQLRLAEEKARLEDHLRQAQRVEAVGRLAGGVAHDFNNLTAIILGYGEMLLRQLRPEDPARRWAEQIVGAGRRSADLTRQLLAFSRRQTLQSEVLDLNALLRNLEEMLARLIGEDIELKLALAADLGRVKADPGRIEQVVTNLVLNARDAMPRGGRLTVETADAELDESYALDHEGVIPGRYVMLAVTDSGCGMDKATMARIFEPFFTTKEWGKGTGLGLASAYGTVKQSGGYIWASTEPGKGSAFKIYLPRTDAEPAAKAVAAGGEATRGRGERILLVEDDAAVRELCESMLSRLGYRVSAAGDGRQALALIDEKALEPDLVVTDVIMPGMSGLEVVDRLRRERPELRVLYMSGYPDDAIARHGVLEPGTPFIQKPFTERTLAEKVREALRGGAAAARPGRSVLMIDDDESFRGLVRLFCTRGGHVLAGVDSSAGALEALAEQAFDVLLVDLNIPGTDGERILREIRAAGHATPAIVLTGDLASADMEVLRPLGAVGALEKSSSAEPLLQAIEDAVAGR